MELKKIFSIIRKERPGSKGSKVLNTNKDWRKVWNQFRKKVSN